MWLAAGVFLCHLIQSAPLSRRNWLIFLLSISREALFNSFSAPKKLLPLSDCISPHISSSRNHSSKSLDKWVSIYLMSHLSEQLYLKAYKHCSISLEVWSLFLDIECFKHTNATVSKRWCFSHMVSYPFFTLPICQFFLLELASIIQYSLPLISLRVMSLPPCAVFSWHHLIRSSVRAPFMGNRIEWVQLLL